MNTQTNDIMVGMIAGIATALLCLGVATGSGLSIILYSLSAVPIMVAGLGWGLRASAIAIGVVLLAVLVIANVQTAIWVLVTTALPAATTAYWLTLSRPASELGGPDDKLAWYPLSDVLLRLCLITSTAFIIIGVMVGYSAEMLAPIVGELIERIQANNPEVVFSDEGKADLVDTMTNMIPFIQPLTWTMILLGNLYIALKITKKSGQLKRPQDDFPATMRMPKISLIMFAAALLISFLPNNIGFIGAALAGGLFAGFTLAGYALVHDVSRGRPWRSFVLIILYAATLVVVLPAFLLSLIGLFATARKLPISNHTSHSNQ